MKHNWVYDDRIKKWMYDLFEEQYILANLEFKCTLKRYHNGWILNLFLKKTHQNIIDNRYIAKPSIPVAVAQKYAIEDCKNQLQLFCDRLIAQANAIKRFF